MKLALNYKVVLRKSEEGYSVSCPDLPGCWSQGETETAALANLRVAIQEYLEEVAFVRAMAEGENTATSSRDEISKLFE